MPIQTDGRERTIMMTGDNRYEVSPLAEIFAPPGTGGAVTGLSVGDFERPVLLWLGRIVFGLDTYEACRAAGIEPRFEELSSGVFPLERIIGEAAASSRMSRSQRGIAAHMMTQLSSGGWAALGLPGDVAAHLPRYNQRQAASLFGVGPGLVSLAGRVFDEDGHASLELQQAAEHGLLTLSSAGKLLDVPPSMQQWLVEQLRSGTARNVAGVLEAVLREAARREGAEDPETFLPDPASVNRFLERIEPTLHHAPLEDLHRFVGAATVDAIVTCPAVTARGLGTLPDLVALADHALKPSGLLVVLAHPKYLEQTVLGLANPDLQHLDAPLVILPKSRRIPGRAPLAHRARNVLLYGRPGTELPPGGDIIQAQKPREGLPAHLVLERVMLPVLRRYTRLGQTVFDPAMLGRPAVALAALAWGRSFIGADRDLYQVEMVRRRLAQVALGGVLPGRRTPGRRGLQSQFPFMDLDSYSG